MGWFLDVVVQFGIQYGIPGVRLFSGSWHLWCWCCLLESGCRTHAHIHSNACKTRYNSTLIYTANPHIIDYSNYASHAFVALHKVRYRMQASAIYEHGRVEFRVCGDSSSSSSSRKRKKGEKGELVSLVTHGERLSECPIYRTVRNWSDRIHCVLLLCRCYPQLRKLPNRHNSRITVRETVVLSYCNTTTQYP